MLELQGLLVAMLLSFGAGPAPAANPTLTLEVKADDGGASMLVEAMSAKKPGMNAAARQQFAAVLAAVDSGDANGLDDAWRSFASWYFNSPKTKAHRRALELLVLAKLTDKHAPRVAKKARSAARFKRRRDRLHRYVAAVEQALAAATKSGKPVAIQFAPDGTGTDANRPLTAEQLQERLVTAKRNRDAMNQSLSTQLLALQQQLQTDNRQFTVVASVIRLN